MKPRKMMTNRNYNLRSTKGYIVDFKANEPTIVPSLVIEEAIGIGAAFCEEDANFFPQNNVNTAAEPLYGFERKEAVLTACNRMIERNDPDEFTSTGLPKMKVIESEVGFSVDRKEVNETWASIQRGE